MNNNQCDNKNKVTSTKYKVLGVILLIIGLACISAGVADFFVHLKSHGMPALFFLCFLGVPCAAAGGFCIALGFKKKANDSKDTQATEDDKATSNSSNSEEGNVCSECGHKNQTGTKFCAKCGAIITKTCPCCGAENDESAKRCSSCGKNIE